MLSKDPVLPASRKRKLAAASRLSLVLVAALVFACGPSTAARVASQPVVRPQATVEHRAFEGRSYRLLAVQRPAAVVLVLHPFHGSGDAFAATTHFDDVARTRDWLAVYPDAPGGAWNAGFCCPFGDAPQRDDGSYLARLLADLGADPRRTLVAGFSNGGMMAYELACTHPGLVAAMFVDAADSVECAPSPPFPAIVHEQGDADQQSGNRVWGLRGGTWVNTEPSAVTRWQRFGAAATLVRVPGGAHTWFPDATARATQLFDSIARR